MSHIVSASNLHVDPNVLRIVRRKLTEEFGVDASTITKAQTRNLAELVKSKVYCGGSTNAAVLRNFASGEYTALANAPKRADQPRLSVAGPRDLTIKRGEYSTASSIRNNLDRINAGQPPFRSLAQANTKSILWSEA